MANVCDFTADDAQSSVGLGAFISKLPFYIGIHTTDYHSSKIMIIRRLPVRSAIQPSYPCQETFHQVRPSASSGPPIISIVAPGGILIITSVLSFLLT